MLILSCRQMVLANTTESYSYTYPNQNQGQE